MNLVRLLRRNLAAYRTFPKGHLARRNAGWSVFFMLTEAAVGAGLVLLEYVADDARAGRAVWMGVHLVNTFLLLGALTSTWVRATHTERIRWSDQGAVGAVVGAGLGAIFGGGKGAAVGAGVGGAAGAGTQVITKGRTVRIPSETRLTFVLDTAVRI